MTPRRSVSTSLKSCQRSVRLKRDNKNASEPMWFRGVSASMGLCFDLGTVLEGHPDVLFAVDGDVVHHRQPVGFPELRQRLPVP